MGNYYIGQTPFLPISNTSLLVALENPADSRVNIYLNVSTITSMQALGFVEFYLGPNLEGKTTSNLFSVTNTNFEKTPKGIIKYFEPAILPTNSTSIFTRYIPNPGTEIVDGGQIILSPGTSFFVYLNDTTNPLTNVYTRVAFGWWEEHQPPCHCIG